MTCIHSLEEYRLISNEEYFARFGEIEAALEEIRIEWDKETPGQKQEEIKKLEEKVKGYPDWMKIHLLSFCMKAGNDKETARRLLDVVLNADYAQVGEYNKLSHYWQISTAIFENKQLESFEAEFRLARLYKELFQSFAAVLGAKGRKYIPAAERNKNLVFVFSSQVLGMLHAPTKTLLDRCYVLQKYMRKRVLIVNTAMQIPRKGAAPFFEMKDSVYNAEYLTKTELEYKGEHFAFLQCEDDMPNLDTIVSLAKLVVTQKPEFLLNIGGSDICADICGLFVPEITVSTVFSKLPFSCGEYQIVDKELTEEDVAILRKLEVKKENVKRTLFTFSFKEQEHHFTKEQLGFREEQFVLLIVGWRLDEEISDEFLQMLDSVCRKDARIVAAFMGKYQNYEESIKRYPLLAANSRCLGAQEDALAVTECMDLYVNPKRNGGGSSVAEALYKGLPAVTLPVGDVSAAAGESFRVADYGEMAETILHFASDEDYYERMSRLAEERAEQLMDSKNSFCGVIDELEQDMN